MRWNNHSDLEGEHALLAPSQPAWLNYDDEKLREKRTKQQASVLGTRLHLLAAEHILLGMKMPRSKKTFDSYVNDAIGFKMSPEVVLFYSIN